MSHSQHPLQLIEDDTALAQSIVGLLTSLNHACTHYKNAEDFLLYVKNNPQAMTLTSCIISDVRLPQLSGIDVLHHVKREHADSVWPIILMTGHGDVAMAVDAMHAGAFDFLIKPFDPYLLLDKVDKAIAISEQIKDNFDFTTTFKSRLMKLTEQENIVCKLMLQNKSSREIAELLGNSSRTIEVHRATILKKMGFESLLQFAQQHERYEVLKNITKGAHPVENAQPFP